MQTNMVCPWRPTALKIAVSFCMLGAIASEAAAQQPTKAQENALRSACRKDFIAHCSKVKPSGPAALACLQRNAASLSSACRTAVSAVGGGPAPAGSAPAGAAPAGAAPAAAAPDQPAPTQAATATAPTQGAGNQTSDQQPTKAQENAIRSACRKDFISHCSKVKPSGPAALACLQRNAASLSSACRTAVSAVGGGSAAAAATPSARRTSARPSPYVRLRRLLREWHR
jgi:Cysteine rich repeat